MKLENKSLTRRNISMIRSLSILMFCFLLQGSIYAGENGSISLKDYTHKSCKGPAGRKGRTGPAGDPGPDFHQFACLYNSAAQTISSGDNVLFPLEISLAGMTYDNTTGTLTLDPGTYTVTYFSYPTGNFNLVANGGIVPNAALAGAATILTLSNETNTLVLQAQSNNSLPVAGTNQCNAMITVYRIN